MAAGADRRRCETFVATFLAEIEERNDMIRAAIVGLGWWGRNLVNSVARGSEAIRFITAHTRHATTAAAFCRGSRAALGRHLEAILADPTIDAVVFATPHTQHVDQVIRASAAGKHVFVEKPFSLSVAEAKRAMAASGRPAMSWRSGSTGASTPRWACCARPCGPSAWACR